MAIEHLPPPTEHSHLPTPF